LNFGNDAFSPHQFPFNWGERTYVMGIVNTSPDSFSGDGLSSVDAACQQGLAMVANGADVLDVGGESTRPDFAPVDCDEERRRVLPVIRRLAMQAGVPVSIDTYKYDVARAAVEAGAGIINDIWALKKEPRLADLAAESGIPIILMSNQRDAPCRDDIVEGVKSDLTRAIAECRKAGVAAENIIIDPGIGFGKTLEQNLELVARLDELRELGRPILLGVSRKSMIGLVLDLPVADRLEGTAAVNALGIAGGADIIRVHDVKQMLRVSRISDAIVRRTGRAE
jgi:dihydropteroate synthase